MTAEHAAAAGGEVEALADVVFFGDMSSDASKTSCRIIARAILADGWVHNATAADTVLATARRLCCGDNPAPHHAATDAHSQRMAFAEELARAVRGS